MPFVNSLIRCKALTRLDTSSSGGLPVSSSETSSDTEIPRCRANSLARSATAASSSMDLVMTLPVFNPLKFPLSPHPTKPFPQKITPCPRKPLAASTSGGTGCQIGWLNFKEGLSNIQKALLDVRTAVSEVQIRGSEVQESMSEVQIRRPIVRKARSEVQTLVSNFRMRRSVLQEAMSEVQKSIPDVQMSVLKLQLSSTSDG